VAKEFDAWVGGSAGRLDLEALLDFRRRAPAAHLALPTWEHYAPLLVAAGAQSAAPERRPFRSPAGGWTARSRNGRSSSADVTPGDLLATPEDFLPTRNSRRPRGVSSTLQCRNAWRPEMPIWFRRSPALLALVPAVALALAAVAARRSRSQRPSEPS